LTGETEEERNDDEETKDDVNPLPLTISGTVLETEAHDYATSFIKYSHDFLGHLPPASTYLLVEIDLKGGDSPVKKTSLAHFEK